MSRVNVVGPVVNAAGCRRVAAATGLFFGIVHADGCPWLANMARRRRDETQGRWNEAVRGGRRLRERAAARVAAAHTPVDSEGRIRALVQEHAAGCPVGWWNRP